MGYYYDFKISVIGGPQSGKDTFCKSVTETQFEMEYKSTIGVDFYLMTFDRKGVKVRLTLWSFICNNEIVEDLRHKIAGTQALIVLVDLTNERAIQITKEWINALVIPTRKKNRFPCVAVVGTKADLKDRIVIDERDLESIVNFIRENLMVECTLTQVINALDKNDVEKLLKEIANRIIELETS